ncbi:MAG: hypothetical protein ACRD0A_01605 [Acidimicrobiales bacterium]
MRRTALVVALACALLLAGAACNGSDDDTAGGDTPTADDAGSTTTTAAPTTTEAPTTTLTPEEEVLAAYRAAKAAIDAAHDPPNPNHPDLLALVGGEALTRTQGLLTQLQGQGVAVVGTTETHPTLVSLAGESAQVEDCFVNRSQYVNPTTREPIGQAGETVLHVRSELERLNGTWKLTASQELSDPCTPS